MHTSHHGRRDQGPRREFLRIMTASVQRMVSGVEPPYDEGMRLMAELGPVLTQADFAGAA
jgi:hypothetical protein